MERFQNSGGSGGGEGRKYAAPPFPMEKNVKAELIIGIYSVAVGNIGKLATCSKT